MKQSTPSPPTQQVLSQILSSEGFEHFGFTPLRRPVSLEIYREWLNEQKHGDMGYLERHLPQKANPQLLMPRAITAIVFALPYWPQPKPSAILSHLKIAKYAQSEDYHDWIYSKLTKTIEVLKKNWPREEFVAYTDSAPVLERELAYWSGLGWYGKNSCLIHKKRGSHFFIAEIFTSLNLHLLETTPHPDFCGTCNRCIEACPTSAILPNKTIDARRCISYLTIEAKGVPSVELRSQIGDHFFGCDICQDVCPWNGKILQALEKTPADMPLEGLIADLKFVLDSDCDFLLKQLCNTPLSRAKCFGLKRNALIVIANRKMSELKYEVLCWQDDPRLGELARWTLSHL